MKECVKYYRETMNKRPFRGVWPILVYMMLCLAFMPGSSYAASAPRLNKSKITLNAGKNYKLKLKNYRKKAKWKSSNPYVAKVSGKGIVKAKHMGYTVISVQAGETTLQCRVTVRGKKKEKPYIFCYETDREGKTIETGSSYNLGVMNGYNRTWTWTVDNTQIAGLYSNGDILSSTVLPGKHCQLVETYMGRSGIANITARSGSKTLHYKLVVRPSGLDTVYTQMRTQVISQLVRPGMSDQEICLALAKWLCDYASYAVTNGPDYSLLQTHIGQCYHYARTYDFLMDGTSIPCDYISTKAHAWNQVLIDGQWYNVDVTGIDTDNPRYPYNYLNFMVSDSAFWRKDSRNKPYNFCVSTRYDFLKPYSQSPWATGTWVNY